MGHDGAGSGGHDDHPAGGARELRAAGAQLPAQGGGPQHWCESGAMQHWGALHPGPAGQTNMAVSLLLKPPTLPHVLSYLRHY